MKNYSLTKLLSCPCGKYSGLEYLVMLGRHTVAYKYSNSITYLNFWKLIVIYYLFIGVIMMSSPSSKNTSEMPMSNESICKSNIKPDNYHKVTQQDYKYYKFLGFF